MLSGAAGLIVTAGLTGLLTTLFIGYHLDRSFIIYRYAANLASGPGFVYNAGEAVLSDVVAPLYVFLLSLMMQITPDLPLLGQAVGIAGVAIGGLALVGLLIADEDYLAAPISAAVYVGFPLLWMTLGLETAFWMALCLLATWMHRKEWATGAAILLALATLTRPETAALLLVLVAASLVDGRPFHPLPASLYTGIVAIGVLWGFSSFEHGGPLPGLSLDLASTGAFEAIHTGLFAFLAGGAALSWLWVIIPLLAVPGIISIKVPSGTLILLGWALLHLVGVALLGTHTAIWAFAPLLPATASLAGRGLQRLVLLPKDRLPRWGIGAVGILLIAGAVGQSVFTVEAEEAAWEDLTPARVAQNDIAAGSWLADNTLPGASVGVTHLGINGYIANRYILDYSGLIQPDLDAAYQRGDSQWWLGEYTPDYVVLSASELERLGDYPLAADAWFTGTYREIARFDAAHGVEEPLLIFERTASIPPLSDRLAGMVSYTNGLTLNRIATDFSLDPLSAGQTGRMRLEWLLTSPVKESLVISLRVQGREGNIAALSTRTIDFNHWPQNRLLTTYHTIELLPGLTPGVYDIEVGIGTDPYALTWQTVTQAKIPFSDEAFVGGITGTRADFGDIALLGYRIVRGEQTLTVSLIWQAVAAPRVDYRVVIQVRDDQGTISARIETQPHDGTYPTSIWSAGEEVSDTYEIPITGLSPGHYEVYVGLIGPDSVHLLTLSGQNAVLVGHLSILGDNE